MQNWPSPVGMGAKKLIFENEPYGGSQAYAQTSGAVLVNLYFHPPPAPHSQYPKHMDKANIPPPLQRVISPFYVEIRENTVYSKIFLAEWWRR